MDTNQQKNIEYYNKLYNKTSIVRTLEKIKNIDLFLDEATSTDISWVGLYKKDLRHKVRGKKILELGCGDCTNAAILASLGAELYANDIAGASGEIVEKLNTACSFEKPIKFINGDFLQANLADIDFDFVLGKAFLHHLTENVERQFFKKIVEILKIDGEARFFEPAVNSRILDEIRWYIPVLGRPSKLNRPAFKLWKEKDPHPDRDNSSRHYRELGREFFEGVEIIPLGALERFYRILPKNFDGRNFRKKALLLEGKLPSKFNEFFARSQMVILKGIKSNN